MSTTGPLGRKYSEGEIKLAKKEWLRQCAEDDDLEEPELQVYEAGIIRPTDDKPWSYELSEGHLISVTVESDLLVDVMIAREADYKKWADGSNRAKFCDFRDDVRVCTLEHEVKKDGDYVVFVYNDDGKQDADVTVSIAIWPVEDEDEEDEDEDEDEEDEDEDEDEED